MLLPILDVYDVFKYGACHRKDQTFEYSYSFDGLYNSDTMGPSIIGDL